jgi:hypothetical protein
MARATTADRDEPDVASTTTEPASDGEAPPRRSQAVPESGQWARPATAYATILSAFAAGHLLASLLGRLPPLRWLDVALLALATFRIGRVVATDEVTYPLRAPFVDAKLKRPRGESPRIEETPTGSGLRVAMGQLLTCPTCAAFWGAAIQVWGLMLVPGLARPFIWLMAASGGAELLGQASARLQQSSSE